MILDRKFSGVYVNVLPRGVRFHFKFLTGSDSS